MKEDDLYWTGEYAESLIGRYTTHLPHFNWNDHPETEEYTYDSIRTEVSLSFPLDPSTSDRTE